jgi:hypothetical protein
MQYNKPKTDDKINYTLFGCNVYYLTINDIIKKGDFIRTLIETGEEGGFDITYKPENWNGLSWHKVENDLSGWIGETYKDFLNFMMKDKAYIPVQEDMFHEIVRII